MEQFLLELASKYPVVVAVCSVVGIFRLVFKPTVALVKLIVAATPSESDDKVVADIEASGIWKAVLWVVDYLLSIKLPGKK
jgi:hypothetical protein